MTLRLNSWYFRRFEAWNRFDNPDDKKELREQIANGRRIGMCEYFRGVIFGTIGTVLGTVIIEPIIRLVELVIALVVVREVTYPAIKDGIAATDAYKLVAARYHAFRAKTCPVISFTE